MELGNRLYKAQAEPDARRNPTGFTAIEALGCAGFFGIGNAWATV
jgi:hypothetical protein